MFRTMVGKLNIQCLFFLQLLSKVFLILIFEILLLRIIFTSNVFEL